MDKAKVSVVVPLYNAEKYVGRCIESILSQTFKEIEVIVVDDGSTDNGVNAVRETAGGDPRLKIIRQKNAGAGVARNRGMEKATGDYFLFWDSDDFFEPNAIELFYNRATETGADITVSGAYNYIDLTGERLVDPSILRRSFLEKPQGEPNTENGAGLKDSDNTATASDGGAGEETNGGAGDGETNSTAGSETNGTADAKPTGENGEKPKKEYFSIYSSKTLPQYIFNVSANVPWNKMFRAEFIRENGLKFQALPQANDTYFSMMATYLAEKIAVVDTPLVNYRTQTTTSITRTQPKDPLASIKAYTAVFNELKAKISLENGEKITENPIIKSFLNRAVRGLLRAFLLQKEEWALKSFYEELNVAFKNFGIDKNTPKDCFYFENDYDNLMFFLNHSMAEYIAYTYTKEHFKLVSEQQKVSDKNAQIKTQKGRIADLKTKVSALKEKNANLKAKVSALKEKNANLKAKLKTQKAKINDLKANLSAEKEKRQKLENRKIVKFANKIGKIFKRFRHGGKK